MELMKYNLDEQFSRLSIKQITAMIHRRMVKDAELIRLIEKYDCYPYRDSNQWIKKLSKWEKEQVEIGDWMDAASANLSADLWNGIVAQPVKDSEGNTLVLVDIWYKS